MKIHKATVLTGASALLGVGSFVVNVLTKKDETKKVAEEAAKIVMEQTNQK